MDYRWFTWSRQFGTGDTSEARRLQTIKVFISVSAGLRCKIGLCDLQEVFFQSKRIQRLLFVKLPKEGVNKDTRFV